MDSWKRQVALAIPVTPTRYVDKLATSRFLQGLADCGMGLWSL
jgi:hypothetical protein